MALMGACSGLIGVLPSYDRIGIGAPILLILLRMLQGFAVGGEWGGAALMAAEHAPAGRRGLFTALTQSGVSSGGAFAAGVMALITLLPREQLLSWGWRLPFLASFALLGLGLYVRVGISESPLFNEMDRLEGQQRDRRRPMRELFRHYKWAVLQGIVMSVPTGLVASLVGSFAVSYSAKAGYSSSIILISLLSGYLVSVLLSPVYGTLSDRLGRRPVYLFGSVGTAVMAFPLFWALDSGSVVLLFLAFGLAFGVFCWAMVAPLAAMLSELFPTSIRYSGVSTSYQLGSIAGGVTPLIAGSLLAASGGATTLISLYVVVIGLIATAVVAVGRETTGRELGASRSRVQHTDA